MGSLRYSTKSGAIPGGHSGPGSLDRLLARWRRQSAHHRQHYYTQRHILPCRCYLSAAPIAGDSRTAPPLPAKSTGRHPGPRQAPSRIWPPFPGRDAPPLPARSGVDLRGDAAATPTGTFGNRERTENMHLRSRLTIIAVLAFLGIAAVRADADPAPTPWGSPRSNTSRQRIIA